MEHKKGTSELVPMWVTEDGQNVVTYVNSVSGEIVKTASPRVSLLEQILEKLKRFRINEPQYQQSDIKLFWSVYPSFLKISRQTFSKLKEQQKRFVKSRKRNFSSFLSQDEAKDYDMTPKEKRDLGEKVCRDQLFKAVDKILDLKKHLLLECENKGTENIRTPVREILFFVQERIRSLLEFSYKTDIFEFLLSLEFRFSKVKNFLSQFKKELQYANLDRHKRAISIGVQRSKKIMEEYFSFQNILEKKEKTDVKRDSKSYSKKQTPEDERRKESFKKKIKNKINTLDLKIAFGILFVLVPFLIISLSVLMGVINESIPFFLLCKIYLFFILLLNFTYFIRIRSVFRALSAKSLYLMLPIGMADFVFILLILQKVFLAALIFLIISCMVLIFSLEICNKRFGETTNFEKKSDIPNYTLKDLRKDLSLDSLSCKYHQNKAKMLNSSMFFLILLSTYLFIFFPLYWAYPIFLLSLMIVIFSAKAKVKTKKKLFESEYGRAHSNKIRKGLKRPRAVGSTVIYYNQIQKGLKYDKRISIRTICDEKYARESMLITIFLILMPLVFAVSSLEQIQSPGIQFALLPQENRNISTEELEFKDDFSDIELTWNSAFITKSIITSRLGIAFANFFTLTPYNSSLVREGKLEVEYNMRTEYLFGPKVNHSLTSTIELDQYDLLPGEYSFKTSYSAFDGFGEKKAYPETYNLTLTKDEVSIEQRLLKDFGGNIDLNAGGVYTLKHNDSWSVIYNFTMKDSLGNPVQGEVDLYLENNNRYEKIATVESNESGVVEHTHVRFGYFEENALAKVRYSGNEKYFPMEVEEYAGTEDSYDGKRFIEDLNEDGYPDWPFSLKDLLSALGEEEKIFKFEVGSVLLDTTIDSGTAAFVEFQHNL